MPCRGNWRCALGSAVGVSRPGVSPAGWGGSAGPKALRPALLPVPRRRALVKVPPAGLASGGEVSPGRLRAGWGLRHLGAAGRTVHELGGGSQGSNWFGMQFRSTITQYGMGLIWSIRCPVCGHVGRLGRMAEAFDKAARDRSMVLVQESRGRGRLTKAERLTRAQAVSVQMEPTTRAILEVALRALDGALGQLGGSGDLGDMLQHAAQVAAHSTMVDVARGHAAPVAGSYAAIHVGVPAPQSHPYRPSTGTFETVTANEAAARRR